MYYDYSKHGYLLPEGCKDLIDVWKLDAHIKALKHIVGAGDPEGSDLWKIIYAAARKAGLTEAEAQKVVQGAMALMAKLMEDGKLNSTTVSFTEWLMTLTRWRIIDQIRKRGRKAASL